IISSSSGKHWVLPKGHIDGGESPEAAALRELKEEAGVKGQILAPLLIQKYKKAEENVIIQYYLVRMIGVQVPKEDRILRWEDGKTALKMLSFKEAKSALREAVDVIGRNP
ncbi:MAG: NUDIX domain-containing protein, partial [Anaerolineales bacterium]|nr:NUDIX domain-containing protein [Anaerolineales bacterium]